MPLSLQLRRSRFILILRDMRINWLYIDTLDEYTNA